MQTKLDNILYPSLISNLEWAFTVPNELYGGTDKVTYKDDILLFFDTGDKQATAIKACQGTNASDGSLFVKGIQALVGDVPLNAIGDLTDASGSDCRSWDLASSGNLQQNFKVHYNESQVKAIRYTSDGSLVNLVGLAFES